MKAIPGMSGRGREREREGDGDFGTVRQARLPLEIEWLEGLEARSLEPADLGAGIIAREYEDRKPLAPLQRQPVVIAKAEERRRGREVVPGEPAGTIHREHLDEVPAAKLDQPVGGSHAIVVEGARRQRKPCFLEQRCGAIEVANSQHQMIDATSGCHVTPVKCAPVLKIHVAPTAAPRSADIFDRQEH
jgi:hypothetical protein